jgi:hypothetical protein
MKKSIQIITISTVFFLTGCQLPMNNISTNPSPTTIPDIPKYYVESIIAEYQNVQENLNKCNNKKGSLENDKTILSNEKDYLKTNYTSILGWGGIFAAGTTVVLANVDNNSGRNPLYNALTIVFATIAGFSKFFIDKRVESIDETITKVDSNNKNIQDLLTNVGATSVFLNNKEYLEKLSISDQQIILSKLKELNITIKGYCPNINKDNVITLPEIPVVSTPSPTATPSPSPTPTAVPEAPVEPETPKITPNPPDTPTETPTPTATPTETTIISGT